MKSFESIGPIWSLDQFPCFHHFLMNIFRRMRLKYENYSLRNILFLKFKQDWHDKSLITKNFDKNALKMKATNLI